LGNDYRNKKGRRRRGGRKFKAEESVGLRNRGF
jgi:hypothetical protein